MVIHSKGANPQEQVIWLSCQISQSIGDSRGSWQNVLTIGESSNGHQALAGLLRHTGRTRNFGRLNFVRRGKNQEHYQRGTAIIQTLMYQIADSIYLAR